MNAQERKFWGYVDICSDTAACWPWTRGTTKGYGRVKFNGRAVQTHRLAYSLFYGSIPNDLCVCHACDNPTCCNPFHLWVGTQTANNNDKILKGRHRNRPRKPLPHVGYATSNNVPLFRIHADLP